MRAKQICGDPRSLCRYAQGRNLSSSFFVNLDPCPGQGKKLWYVLRVYLDPEIDSYCCRTIAASPQKKGGKKKEKSEVPFCSQTVQIWVWKAVTAGVAGAKCMAAYPSIPWPHLSMSNGPSGCVWSTRALVRAPIGPTQ